MKNLMQSMTTIVYGILLLLHQCRGERVELGKRCDLQYVSPLGKYDTLIVNVDVWKKGCTSQLKIAVDEDVKHITVHFVNYKHSRGRRILYDNTCYPYIKVAEHRYCEYEPDVGITLYYDIKEHQKYFDIKTRMDDGGGLLEAYIKIEAVMREKEVEDSSSSSPGITVGMTLAVVIVCLFVIVVFAIVVCYRRRRGLQQGSVITSAQGTQMAGYPQPAPVNTTNPPYPQQGYPQGQPPTGYPPHGYPQPGGNHPPPGYPAPQGYPQGSPYPPPVYPSQENTPHSPLITQTDTSSPPPSYADVMRNDPDKRSEVIPSAPQMD